MLGGLLTSALFLATASAANNKNQLPDIGAAGGSVLSIDKERLIGQAMMKQLRATSPLINDPVLNEYINDLGNQLVKNAQDVHYSFEFFLIKNQELNAFAFFGGHVGIHSGLLTTADTESELASVIAHEISHVTQRHLARKLESQSNAQPLALAGIVSGVLLSLVNPTVGMAALMGSMALSQQASINYTRSNEKEADRVGIALLSYSGFDPQGAPDFFGKMSEKYRYKSTPPPMLLTHPIPASRITDARQRAHSFPKRTLAPKLSFELAKARIIARYQNDPSYNIRFYQKKLRNKNYAIKEAAQYGLAVALLENKKYSEAQQVLEPLFSLDKNNLFYADVLSDIYLGLKDFDTAINMLEQLNALMPNNQVVTLNYANVLMSDKKLDESASLLQDFLLTQPKNVIVYDLLTNIYKQQKKPALMHSTKAEMYALLGAYQKSIDELHTAYNFTKESPIIRRRIKARILQIQAQEDKLKRLAGK
tara:strand:- start:521 stop:1960 length:1440 start_codon:yes stop_codon:yes gene_type:complete